MRLQAATSGRVASRAQVPPVSERGHAASASGQRRCSLPTQGVTLFWKVIDAIPTRGSMLNCRRPPPAMTIPHDLLQPSLQHDARPARAPFSQLSGFVAAFLGGPPAALLMAGLNTARLQRWSRDLFWLLPGLLAWPALEWWLMRGDDAMLAALGGWFGTRTPEVLRRGLALALFGLTALLLHRREHRMADLMGLPRPKGFWPGLAVIVAGNLLSYGLIWLLVHGYGVADPIGSGGAGKV